MALANVASSGNGLTTRQMLFKMQDTAKRVVQTVYAQDAIDGVIVTTEYESRDRNGAYFYHSSMVYVPGVMIAADTNGGKKLVDRA